MMFVWCSSNIKNFDKLHHVHRRRGSQAVAYSAVDSFVCRRSAVSSQGFHNPYFVPCALPWLETSFSCQSHILFCVVVSNVLWVAQKYSCLVIKKGWVSKTKTVWDISIRWQNLESSGTKWATRFKGWKCKLLQPNSDAVGMYIYYISLGQIMQSYRSGVCIKDPLNNAKNICGKQKILYLGPVSVK